MLGFLLEGCVQYSVGMCTIIHFCRVENDITAQRFNLSYFKDWPQCLNLPPMDRDDLQQLMGMRG